MLVVLALAGAAIWGLMGLFPGRISTTDDWGDVARSVAVLALVSASLLSMRLKLRDTARYVLIWLALGAAVVAGYAFRADLGDAALRVRSALIPGYAVAAGDHTLALGQDSDGG